MTLREAIGKAHCRHGKAAGTTEYGAYWLCPYTLDKLDMRIHNWGGDGVGQNGADHFSYLELQHYRDGTVRARCHHTSWHQNGSYSGGNISEYVNADSILECQTAEDVIVALKNLHYGSRHFDYATPVYSDHYADTVTEILARLGIPEADQGPDEDATAS